ncbi:MAG: cation acetate symporter [Desulfobacterales bacterium]|nr:cation acetate symporter [Desulfobacterales bacterium]
MIYEASILAVVLFVVFVILVLGISKYFASQTTSSSGYYAAGGTIHWGVNGIAFAGDYLSAASFLGICGMIAFYGYDGFLYSIGYLAGWVVALFVVAEPLKKAGKYTFTDALDSKFNSKSIQLTAAISTLVVSVCYLIPQMVGAGALVKPLLGMPHWVGVIIVGTIVIFIVATAGMASTTYVQFIKGTLLIVFSTVLTICLFMNGFKLKPSDSYHEFKSIEATVSQGKVASVAEPGYTITGQNDSGMVKLSQDGVNTWWQLEIGEKITPPVVASATEEAPEDASATEVVNAPIIYSAVLKEAISTTMQPNGPTLFNGEPKENRKFFQVGAMSKIIVDGKEVDKTGPVGPFKFLETVEKGEVLRFKKAKFNDGDNGVTVWTQNVTSGSSLMRPGVKFKIDKGSTFMSKLNFVSLMIALFFGTSALPHILIRYYTVPSPKDARKSTILAIASIGFFYILTLFMGLGAMTHGVLDLQSSNMSAPLLAKFFGIAIFSIISAIAFATVLGTVSGLIVAAAGAVAQDLMKNFAGIEMTDKGQVKAGKISSIVVGVIAIVLGVLFKGMNVSFLVGLAFAVAASANLPAIIMVLFWKKTSAVGVASSIMVGMITALTIILLSPSMWDKYGLDPATAPIALNNPGIISIPLAFITLVVVSLLVPGENKEPVKLKSAATAS